MTGKTAPNQKWERRGSEGAVRTAPDHAHAPHREGAELGWLLGMMGWSTQTGIKVPNYSRRRSGDARHRRVL